MSKNDQRNPMAIGPETGFEATTPAEQAQPSTQDLSSLKQVRDILVGPLSSELEETVRELDERLDRTVKELSDTTDKHVVAMEDKLQTELGRLNGEIGSHRDESQDRLRDLEQQMRSGLDELRKSIESIGDNVREQLDQMQETVTRKLENESQNLRGELVDRGSLSAALSEVALRLSGPVGAMHEMDPDRPDIDIDKLLDG
jgi:exonuclease VII large subunit